MRRAWVSGQQLAVIAAVIGVLALAGAVASDFIVGSFWSSHAMLTSIVANLIFVLVSVAIVSQWLDRRSRAQWNVLAQNVMFGLAQCARLTWTSMITMQGLVSVADGEVADPTEENLTLALDPDAVGAGMDRLLLDKPRRDHLQLVVSRLSDTAAQVITNWAGVMVGAAPYAPLIDRHVELQSRLEWLAAVMANREPPPDQGGRRRRLTRASVAVQAVAHLGDEWLRDQATAITVFAAQLDRESLDMAFSLNAPEWWNKRTDELLNRRSAGS
jgi:hypothetical protein